MELLNEQIPKTPGENAFLSKLLKDQVLQFIRLQINVCFLDPASSSKRPKKTSNDGEL